MSFSIPCESWGSATSRTPPCCSIITRTFSIPCESWGSATVGVRGRTIPVSLPFQYSLRIVGFCDRLQARRVSQGTIPFSIPCESWGSATAENTAIHSEKSTLSVFPANRGVLRLSMTSATAVISWSFSIPCESWGSATHFQFPHFDLNLGLSVFPANRGVLRLKMRPYTEDEVTPFSIPCESWGSATLLRILPNPAVT